MNHSHNWHQHLVEAEQLSHETVFLKGDLNKFVFGADLKEASP